MSSKGPDFSSVRRRLQQLQKNHTPTSVSGSARHDYVRQPISATATPSENRTIPERQTPKPSATSIFTSTPNTISSDPKQGSPVRLDELVAASNAIPPAYFDEKTLRERATLQRAVKTDPTNPESWYNYLILLKKERKRYIREPDNKMESDESMRQALQAGYENATRVIPKSAVNRHCYYYVSLWIDFAALLAEDEHELYLVREMFKRLKAERIGLLVPQFWAAYAGVEDKLGNKEKAHAYREKAESLANLDRPVDEENAAPPVSRTPINTGAINSSSQNRRIPMRPARRAPKYPPMESSHTSTRGREFSNSDNINAEPASNTPREENRRQVESPEILRSQQKESRLAELEPVYGMSPKQQDRASKSELGNIVLETNRYHRLQERLRNANNNRSQEQSMDSGTERQKAFSRSNENSRDSRFKQLREDQITNESQPSLSNVSHSINGKDPAQSSKQRAKRLDDQRISRSSPLPHVEYRDGAGERDIRKDDYGYLRTIDKDEDRQHSARTKYSDDNSSNEVFKDSSHARSEVRSTRETLAKQRDMEQRRYQSIRQQSRFREVNHSPLHLSGSESVSPPKSNSSSQTTPSELLKRRNERQMIRASPTASGFMHSLPRNHYQTVNGREYLVLESVGKGGSSTVYKVLSSEMKILALKRVKVPKSSGFRATLDSFANEISLLKKLKGSPTIVNLHDAEVREENGTILLIMEYGDTDLAKHLFNRKGAKIPSNFIRVYWQQMLEAVHTIHEARIVHGDLKPANFLIVGGTLKLIDFGIAKAIQAEDTTKIVRDCQVGTPNYMSPEALKEIDGGMDDDDDDSDPYGTRSPRKKRFRVGRASDIWSLGCILYQMVYGRTPFAHIKNIYTKLMHIQNEEYEIDYKRVNDPQVINILRGCLQRDPIRRMSIPELLQHSYLCPENDRENGDGSARAVVVRLMEQLGSCGYEIRSKLGKEVSLQYGEKAYEQLIEQMSACISTDRKEMELNVMRDRLGTPTSSALTQLGTKPTTSGFSHQGTTTKTGERFHDRHQSGYR